MFSFQTFGFQMFGLQRTAFVPRTFLASLTARPRGRGPSRQSPAASESRQAETAKQLGKAQTASQAGTADTLSFSNQVASTRTKRLLSPTQTLPFRR